MDGTAITEARVHELVAEIPVAEVTLLEDRAVVVRRGVIELPPGRPWHTARLIEAEGKLELTCEGRSGRTLARTGATSS